MKAPPPSIDRACVCPVLHFLSLFSSSLFQGLSVLSLLAAQVSNQPALPSLHYLVCLHPCISWWMPGMCSWNCYSHVFWMSFICGLSMWVWPVPASPHHLFGYSFGICFQLLVLSNTYLPCISSFKYWTNRITLCNSQGFLLNDCVGLEVLPTPIGLCEHPDIQSHMYQHLYAVNLHIHSLSSYLHYDKHLHNNFFSS